MPVMHMLWWRASPGRWPNDSLDLAPTSRFGLFNGSILQSMLLGYSVRDGGIMQSTLWH